MSCVKKSDPGHSVCVEASPDKMFESILGMLIHSKFGVSTQIVPELFPLSLPTFRTARVPALLPEPRSTNGLRTVCATCAPTSKSTKTVKYLARKKWKISSKPFSPKPSCNPNYLRSRGKLQVFIAKLGLQANPFPSLPFHPQGRQCATSLRGGACSSREVDITSGWGEMAFLTHFVIFVIVLVIVIAIGIEI